MRLVATSSSELDSSEAGWVLDWLGSLDSIGSELVKGASLLSMVELSIWLVRSWLVDSSEDLEDLEDLGEPPPQEAKTMPALISRMNVLPFFILFPSMLVFGLLGYGFFLRK